LDIADDDPDDLPAVQWEMPHLQIVVGLLDVIVFIIFRNYKYIFFLGKKTSTALFRI